MHLTLDVVDVVLSFLQADTAALRSCTQAHPLLSRLAERHLYYKTTLDIRHGCDLEITELSSLLSKNPHLRNYIHILAINIFDASESPVTDDTPVVKTISSILTTLPCLNKITFTRKSLSSYSWPHLSWNTIHKSIRIPFANILQQSSVTEVHLEGLSAFPLSVFNENIKTLSLSTCDKFERSDLTSPSQYLESLSILNSLDPILFNWAIERIGRLTFLNLRPHSEECTVYQEVFETCARSLTYLELDINRVATSQHILMTDSSSNIYSDAYFQDVELRFTLSALFNLEHLTISARIRAFQEENLFGEEVTYRDFVFYTPLHAIAQLIKSSAPSLRQVVVKLSCTSFSTIGSLLELNWNRFTILGDYPTCPHIDLYISFHPAFTWREFSPEEIMNKLARHAGLMQLVDRGVISIKQERESRS